MWSWTGSDGGTSASTSIAKKESASSELSDCGYGTQVENQESISTSSNEDDAPNRLVMFSNVSFNCFYEKCLYLNYVSRVML